MAEFDLVTWRADARPGDTAAVWSPLRQPLLNPSSQFLELPAEWGAVNLARQQDQGFLRNWLVGIRVPPDAKPGAYEIAWKDVGGERHSVTVKVVKAPAGPGGTIAARSTAATINKALAKGGTFRLNPGYYELEDDLEIPDGVRAELDGQGHATLARKKYGADPKERRIVGLDQGSGTISLRGLRLVGDGPGTYAMHGFPWADRRVDVTDCILENIDLSSNTLAGGDGSSLLARRCTFRWGAGTGELPPRTWLDRCLFDGATAGGWPHACLLSGSDRCLITSNDFRSTARGVMMQATVRGCCVVGNDFSGIDGQQANGGEVMGLETQAEIAYNAFVYNYAKDCSGPGISFQGSGVHDNLFWGELLDCRSQSVYLAQNGAGAIERNTILEFECAGGVWVEGNCRQNSVAVVVRELPRSSGNQPLAEEYYRRGLFVDRSGGGNDLTGCRLARAGGGLAPAAVETLTA